MVKRTGTRGEALPPGQGLEREILQLFRTSGFRAQQSVGAAKPRQTDIYARGYNLDLLVEVKDRKRRVDVSDIDNLRARLRRTASDVVGVIFTLSSLTRGALKEIESDRTREIIVFNEAEIELLRSGNARLSSLIERKREELRVQGRAWFRTGAAGEYLAVQLPESTIEFLSGANAKAYFHSNTGFAHAALAMSLPDPGWGNPGGEGARLSLRLTLSSLDDLRDLFGYLHDKFGLSANGAFSIHQSGACWHGTGGDLVDHYSLEGIETTEAEHVQIIRPFGTWNKIIKRAKSEAQLREEAVRDLGSILLEFDHSEMLPTRARCRTTN